MLRTAITPVMSAQSAVDRWQKPGGEPPARSPLDFHHRSRGWGIPASTNPF